MNSSDIYSFKFNLQNSLGLLFIGIALAGLYWVAGMFYSLWNEPTSVPFISIFVELINENQRPFIDGANGQLNWPTSWPIIVGVFLTIVLLSSASILIRTFLILGLCLLFPKIQFNGGLIETLKNRFFGIKN